MQTLFATSGLTKRYPGVIAIDDVNLDIRPGEVHVLVGENGAGKSTLVRCLSGIERPDSGSMEFSGKPFAPATPGDALEVGIQVVHQELSMLPSLSVAENLFIQHLPRRFGVVQRTELRDRSRALLEQVGLDIAPGTRVERLGIAQMQLVEIARALSTDCRLLVMDEPTATLTPKEVSTLFIILRRLTARGVAILYISHHLDEIFEIGDRVTVLRNGRQVTTRDLDEVTPPDLVRLMVGRDLAQEYPPVTARPIGEELLRVDGLRVNTDSPPVSFAVRAGEVVGVAGLVGSGRTEVMRAVFGADHRAAGEVQVHGVSVRPGKPSSAVRRGIGFLTEDRKSQGLVLDLPIAANISLASMHKVSVAGMLRGRTEATAAAAFSDKLRIKATGVSQHPRALSGGNQQKVVLARWLAADTDLLIVDEPTRGIDVGARYEIHQLLLDLAAAGKGLLVVSSDLPEVLGICDRVLVFSRGRIAGEVTRAEFDPERVLELAYSAHRNIPTVDGDAP